MNEALLNLEDIFKARKRISELVIETPLVKSNILSQLFGINLYLKCEFMQEVGSFKIRGASNKALYEIEKGFEGDLFVTASSGNHGIAVAYLAKKLNKKAVIFAPTVATSYKLSLIQSYGGEIIYKGEYSDQATVFAKEYAKERNGLFIHAFDDLRVIEGQATIALELIDQLKNIDYVIIPVGGGGLIAGISFVIKEISKKTKIIAVQPEGNPSLYNALKSGEIITTKGTNTIAEGLAVRRIGDLVFKIVKDRVDEVALVSEEEIINATKLLFEKERILIEPSAGAAISYLLKHKLEKESKAVAILTGRNLSKEHIEKIFSYSG